MFGSSRIVTFPLGITTLSVTDLEGNELDSSQFTLVNETPDILWVNGSGSIIFALREGTGYITVQSGEYSDRLTVHVVPVTDKISLSAASVYTAPGTAGEIQLDVFGSRFFGRDYTVEWTSSDSSVVTIEPYDAADGNTVRYAAQNAGSAVITCRVSLPDGTSAENYCCIHVISKSEPEI